MVNAASLDRGSGGNLFKVNPNFSIKAPTYFFDIELAKLVGYAQRARISNTATTETSFAPFLKSDIPTVVEFGALDAEIMALKVENPQLKNVQHAHCHEKSVHPLSLFTCPIGLLKYVLNFTILCRSQPQICSC